MLKLIFLNIGALSVDLGLLLCLDLDVYPAETILQLDKICLNSHGLDSVLNLLTGKSSNKTESYGINSYVLKYGGDIDTFTAIEYGF